MLARVVTEHEGAAEVGLPPVEDRADIAEHDVVVGDDEVRRILPVRLQRVSSRPRDRLCQCLLTPNISAARSRISSDNFCSRTPARIMPLRSISANNSAALSW